MFIGVDPEGAKLVTALMDNAVKAGMFHTAADVIAASNSVKAVTVTQQPGQPAASGQPVQPGQQNPTATGKPRNQYETMIQTYGKKEGEG